MINIQETAESIVPLANRLADKGIALSPLGGTEMDYLLASVTSYLQDDTNVSNAIVNAMETSGREYRRAVSNAVEKLAKDGKEIIATCRHEIYPTLETLFKQTKNAIEAHRADGIRQYTIVPYTPVELLQSDWARDLFEQSAYRNNAWNGSAPFETKRVFPDRQIGDLIVVMRTEDNRVNAMIDEAVTYYGEAHVQAAYDIFFHINSFKSNVLSELMPMELRNDSEYEGVRLFAMLLAMGFKRVTPSVDMSLSELNTYLTDVMQFNASSLSRFMRNYDKQVEKHYIGAERRTMGSGACAIVVNRDAYEYWQQNGLTDSLIMGAVLSDGQRDAQRMIESKERYQHEYEKYQRVQERSLATNVTYAIQQGVMEATLDYARRIYREEYTAKRSQIKALVTAVLDRVRPSSDADVYRTVKEAVLCIFYPGKAYRSFIDSMDEIMTDSPAIDPRQAATLAFIDTGIQWMLSQMEADKSMRLGR